MFCMISPPYTADGGLEKCCFEATDCRSAAAGRRGAKPLIIPILALH